MLGLEEYLRRKPAALSGGQRQRVAMGRAIVREPRGVGLADYLGRELILGIRPSDFEDASLAGAQWARMRAIAGVTEALGNEPLT
jgi:hypothetical protein